MEQLYGFFLFRLCLFDTPGGPTKFTAPAEGFETNEFPPEGRVRLSRSSNAVLACANVYREDGS
jgi:hypothetical protein